MNRLRSVVELRGRELLAAVLEVLGGLFVVVALIVGGFPDPEGTGEVLLLLGVALGAIGTVLRRVGDWLARRTPS